MSTHKGIFKNSELDKIQEKLKFIGTLEPGQKISVSSSPMIQENTLWTSMVRTLTGDSRQKVFKFISDTIADSLNILEGLSNSSNDFDIQICKNLITDLIFLRPGLTNLQDTYKLDKMYVSKIKVLVENLDVKIRELCHKRDIDYEQLYENVTAMILERQTNVAKSTSENAEKATDDNTDDNTDENADVENESDEENADDEKIRGGEDCEENCGEETCGGENGCEIKDQCYKQEKKKNDDVEESSMLPLVDEKVDNVLKITVDKTKLLPDIPTYADVATRSRPPSRQPPVPPKGSQDDSDHLVSFLRTLPSEDLLLMSTQQPTGSSTHGTGPSNVPASTSGGRLNRRKRKQKHAYQYDTYYMSPPDDITLCNSDLEKGIIR
jgi:hypothetical protein